MGFEKPHWCFGDCEVIFSRYSREGYDKGASSFCYGKMTREQRFVEKETEHINDFSHCLYTPLKGIIRFFLNKDDAYMDFLAICAVLDKYQPHICKNCGPIPWRYGPINIDLEGNSYCQKCWLLK